jgi:hypothetical protein
VVFGGIGLISGGLKSALYSNEPCNDSIKMGAKALNPTPPPYDVITDEVIDYSIEWYIEEYNLPRK